MTKQEVFEYIESRVKSGSPTITAAEAALKYFSNTPERAVKLVRDILGAQALRQFYLDVHAAARQTIYEDPATKTPAASDRTVRPAKSRADAAVRALASDPGAIRLEVPGSGYMAISDMKREHVRALIDGFTGRAKAYTTRALWWSSFDNKYGDAIERKTIGRALTLAQRREAFGDVAV